MMKKEYLVSALGTERLAEAVIEAETPEEAMEHYEAAWSNGEISAFGYEFSDWRIREANAEEEPSEENRSKTFLLVLAKELAEQARIACNDEEGMGI